MILILSFILFSVYINKKKKREKMFYIQIPDYVGNSIEDNLQYILDDHSVPKLSPKDIELGTTIGSGGQAMVKKKNYFY